ncbi:hypothetical protein AAVH_28810 [Aphelenchoides avenae]|nr:hypothetical protein AAVH_28810 [Aphelenchus avenae]
MSLFLLFVVLVLPLLVPGAEAVLPDLPDCAKPDFWKSVKSPACAHLDEYTHCDGNPAELPIGEESNGTAKSAAIRPGPHLYEGRRELLKYWE